MDPLTCTCLIYIFSKQTLAIWAAITEKRRLGGLCVPSRFSHV